MSAGRPLIVGIDARSTAGQPTGVGRYVGNLARAAAGLDPDVRLRIYVPSPPGEALTGIDAETVVLGPLGGVSAIDNVFTWNHVRLPLHLVRRRVDLLHGPFYTLPAACPCPAVVTIHDITFDMRPEWFSSRARLAFSGFARASARKARHVLTVSERSRADIVSAYGVPASRVTAVPLAPDPDFAPVRDPRRLAALRARYGLGDAYVLHVGSITPRRNIDRLLDAFATVQAVVPHLRLALVGRVEPPATPLEPQIERRGLAAAVRAIGYVDQSDLPALYSGAAALAYPSLYEGFGLPVLEAMACGVPVLTSTTSSLPEVAGDAALLVDPEDTGAIAAGLRSLLTDPSLRDRLVDRGLARARAFSWDRTARETLAVYREALGLAPAREGRR